MTCKTGIEGRTLLRTQRSATMFNRRGFVSGAIYATIATIDLASSQRRADAQALPEYPLKTLKKTEYPGDHYVCVLVKLDLSPGDLSRDICIRASNSAI